MNYRVVTEYNSIDIEKWDKFVKNHPNGNIFQTPELYKAYKSEKYYEPIIVVCIDENDEIAGLLMSVIQREFRGILGKLSSRSVIWGAPLIKYDNPDVLKIILSEYDLAVEKKAIYTQIRNLWNTDVLKKDFESLGYEYEDHLNILIDLTKSEDELWKEVYSRRRSQINKSERQGISVRIFKDDENIEKSYEILTEVYQRAKLPLPYKEFFKESGKILKVKDYLKFFGAFYKGNLIGVMYLLCYKNVVYEWYIGSFSEYMKNHPNDLIIWEIFKWSKKNNYEVFDFGGAGHPDKEYGVREYKKKFGGKTLNLGRYMKIHNHFLMHISVTGFKFWQLIKFGFKKK